MVSKDQAIGGLIFLVCVVIAVVYFLLTVFAGHVVNWFGWTLESWKLQLWLALIPVLIAFIAILGIGAWIGWTMATTPPPKPIEEFESEEKIEEEKKEEPKEEKKK